MKKINSPNSIKPCYIAAVKEEMGFPVKRAWNRHGRERKVQPTGFMKEIIKEAIQKTGNSTYKKIQEVALEIYRQKSCNSPIMSFRRIFDDPPSEVKKIAENHEIIYE